MYGVVLSLHVISVICWMAGVLYLIRLMVYHAGEREAVVKSRFVVMEKRLFRYITMPSSIAALIFGAYLLHLNPLLVSYRWMQVKLFLVVVLMGVTHSCGSMLRKLERETSKRSETFFRIYNEIPTVLMIIIVFLVILKPWM